MSSSQVDGCIVDSEGFLWNAQPMHGSVFRINPENGEVDMVVDVPENNPVCACFGGEDMSTLFITTWRGDGDGYGHLYAVKVPEVKGLKENRFVVQNLEEYKMNE